MINTERRHFMTAQGVIILLNPHKLKFTIPKLQFYEQLNLMVHSYDVIKVSLLPQMSSHATVR